MVSDIAKPQKTSPCQRAQKQTNEAKNETTAKAIATSCEHKNPKNHVEEITAKNPPTENLIG